MKIAKNTPFKIARKSGFSCSCPSGLKVTKDGADFYAWKEPVKFNLPAGNYVASEDIEETTPVVYRFKGKRRRERFDISPPKDIKVVWGQNPNKASIKLREGLIFIDNKFKDAPEVLKKFIFYHEKAHYFYKTEEFCDEYAREKLLDEGYNESQINYASSKSLGHENERHFECKTQLKNARTNGR